MGDDRPIRYIDPDGTVVYRASALGTCERAFVACATGTPAAPMPDWFREVLDEGTAAEPVISGMWELQTGLGTVDQQREYDLRIGRVGDAEVIVRCHIDGMSDDPPGARLREYKKFRDSMWPKFLTQGVECGANYPWQVAVCMLAGDFDECEFVGGHMVDGVVTEVKHHLITNPPVTFKAIRDRVKRIERLIQAGFDAKEVDCNKSMYPCPYFKVHDEDDSETYEFPVDGKEGEVAKLLVSNFAVAASKVNMLDKQLKEAKAEKDRHAVALRELLDVLGPDAKAAKKLVNSEYTLTHVTGDVPERVQKGYALDYYKIAVRKDKK